MAGAADFDFWLGEWDCAWEDGQGRNAVARELGGAVIVERFDARPGEDFRGMSVSVFDADEQLWRQTWVDSRGGYLDFTGSATADGMQLEREAADVRFRMRWFDIEPDSLEWTWERASTGGAWETLWAISYRRRLAG